MQWWVQLIIKTRPGWILSPSTDVTFVFGGSLVATLILLLFHVRNLLPLKNESVSILFSFSNTLAVATVFTIMFALNGGHMVAGLFLLLTNRNERSRSKTVEPNIGRRCLLIVGLSVITFGTSAVLFWVSSESNAFKAPIWIAGLIYFLWNGWHFAMQQFGLLQIYRKKNGISTRWDRTLDRVQCFIFVFFIPSLLLFSRGRNDDFFESYLGTLEGLRFFHNEIAIFAFAMATVTITRLSLKKHWRWQTVLCYGGIFLIPIAMSYNPTIFLFLAVLGPHYLQEIFLISSIASVEKSDGQTSVDVRKFAIRLLIFVCASAIFYLVLEQLIHMGGAIGAFGSIYLKSGLSSLQFAAIASVAAGLAILNFFHFYLDRAIFRRRREIL